MKNKPYSEACERNKLAILEQLKILVPTISKVLEIGSGTGQHAITFGKALPRVVWQTSDCTEMHAGIKSWLAEAKLSNVLSPLTLDVEHDEIIDNTFDVVFTANTFHIMSLDNVKVGIRKVGHALNNDGLLIVYGPFKFEGQFTSQSNQQFDTMLKESKSSQGIRDFEEIAQEAEAVQLFHQQTINMPANNFILVFKKQI